jgi:two-component system, chemotaxis family, protein-glutamate methylesterase/glutaminase
MSFKIILIGTSFGGLSALEIVLGNIPIDLNLPIVIVQHRHKDSNSTLRDILQQYGPLPVHEVEDKDEILPGTVYLAPADYHLLVEAGYFGLSCDEPVCFARPSIDVLFESAANVYGEQAIGVILTGANNDGSFGLQRVKARGGFTIVQEPSTAECSVMPKAAISTVAVDWILPLSGIAPGLVTLCQNKRN